MSIFLELKRIIK